MSRFDKPTYLSLHFKFTLSVRLSKSLRGSDALLFSEFINIVSILFHKFNEFIVFLYTFLFLDRNNMRFVWCSFFNAYLSIKSVDCILLSSLELKAILLISLVKTLCLSLFNLYCVFNIIYCFLWILYDLF